MQEGIDAVSDVIYHLETYDITTIRAGGSIVRAPPPLSFLWLSPRDPRDPRDPPRDQAAATAQAPHRKRPTARPSQPTNQSATAEPRPCCVFRLSGVSIVLRVARCSFFCLSI